MSQERRCRPLARKLIALAQSLARGRAPLRVSITDQYVLAAQGAVCLRS
jgi:hypothetical protein